MDPRAPGSVRVLHRAETLDDGFLNTFNYAQERVKLDQYTIVEPAGTKTIYNWLQYFSVESLEEEFRAAGLTIAEVYADVAGAPFDAEAGEFAVVARQA